MGRGLSVFRLESTDSEALRTDIDSLPHGLPLDDEPSQPHSRLRFVGEPRSKIYEYRARHLTEIQSQPIRAFVNEARTAYEDIAPGEIIKRKKVKDLRYGYQEIYEFPVLINFEHREILVYHRSDVSDSLVRRFQQKGNLRHSRRSLDLTRIKSVPGVKSAWGAWTERGGPASTAGYFGENVLLDPAVKAEKTRLFQVAFEDKDLGTIDVSISADCKIGSRTAGVTEDDLLRIYRVFERFLKTWDESPIEALPLRKIPRQSNLP